MLQRVIKQFGKRSHNFRVSKGKNAGDKVGERKKEEKREKKREKERKNIRKLPKTTLGKLSN